MPDETPVVKDSSEKPTGALPANARAKIILALSVLMILVIAFSNRRGSERRPPPAPSNTPSNPDAIRIEELKRRIDEDAKRLKVAQEDLLQRKQELSLSPGLTPEGGQGDWAAHRSGAGPEARSDYRSRDYPEDGRTGYERRPEKDWRVLDAEKREYQSLYAPNVAYTRRDGSKPDSPAQPADRPLAGEDGANEGRHGGCAAGDPAEGKPAPNKLYKIFEGTVIETALVNTLDGTFSGPVKCMVTNPVYDIPSQKVLIPEGSTVLGSVKPVDGFGQRRLAVTFHRLILPNGKSINLSQMPGLNQLGETGLRDQVNNHYMQVFGAALAIGAIAGFSEAGSRSRGLADEPYRRGVSDSLANSSMRILDRFLNVLPTVTIRAGHRVKVYLTADLELPAYAGPADVGTAYQGSATEGEVVHATDHD